MITNRWGECSSPCEDNSPCKNKGTCNFNWVDQKMNCNCSTGYSGERCELEKTIKGTNQISNIALAINGNWRPLVEVVLEWVKS